MKRLETWENVLSVTDVSFATKWSVINRWYILTSSTLWEGVIFSDLHKVNHRHLNKGTDMREVPEMTIFWVVMNFRTKFCFYFQGNWTTFSHSEDGDKSFLRNVGTNYSTRCNKPQHRSLNIIRFSSNLFNSSSRYHEFWGRMFIQNFVPAKYKSSHSSNLHCHHREKLWTHKESNWHCSGHAAQQISGPKFSRSQTRSKSSTHFPLYFFCIFQCVVFLCLALFTITLD